MQWPIRAADDADEILVNIRQDELAVVNIRWVNAWCASSPASNERQMFGAVMVKLNRWASNSAGHHIHCWQSDLSI